MRRQTLVAVVMIGLVAGACADRLPDQDRRILTSAPAAKLSTDLLWKDYAADKQAADRKYWGQVVEVTGTVASVVKDGPAPHVLFSQPAAKTTSAPGIEARPLDDQATMTLAAATPGQRLTLRCFCEGLEGNVVLKSCILPGPQASGPGPQ